VRSRGSSSRCIRFGVESVAWMSEQKSTLSGGLLICRLSLSYLYFFQPDAPAAGKYYLSRWLCFVLSLLSKSVTATLPAVLLVIVWWRNGAARLESATSGR